MSSVLKGFLVAAILVSAAPARAGSSLTLAQAVGEAKANSPEYRMAEEAAEAASWKKLEAFSAFLPHVSALAMEVPEFRPENIAFALGGGPPTIIAFPPFPLSSVTLHASLLVFDGLGSVEHYRAALDGSEAAELRRSRAEFALERGIRERFDEALAARFLLEVSQANLKTLTDHLDDAKAREEAGFSTRFDVLRIEVQMEEAQTDLKANEDASAVARLTLARAMGLEGDDRALEGALPEPKAGAVPEKLDVEGALAARDDLRAQADDAAAASAMHVASLAHWMPKVELSADGTFYSLIDGTSNFTNGYTSYTVALNLQWELFGGGGSYARQMEAYHQSEAADASLRAQKLQAPLDVESGRRKYNLAVARYQGSQRAIEKAEESVRLARVGIRAGTRTNTELLDAELDLFRARADRVRAQLGAEEAMAGLELALGRAI